ncbi:MAG: DUF3142 domain-containing protein [Proteobacteria bacterium]|nr:DUF3142 domain-containing protein [Pseudomonadota bacterium]MCP4916657.1 DUF3142 domain-containing protein [Pseudomonadota bacterium]
MLLLLACTAPRGSGPLPQDAYVWQRIWTPQVTSAVAEHDFRALSVLAAERSWGPDAVAWIELGQLAAGTTLVLRVEAPPRDPSAELLADVARLRAEHPGHPIQVDMDVPTSQLADYARWIEPLDVSVTTLPTWLGDPAYGDLVQAAEHTVLQVHWLDPDQPDHLLDPRAAQHVEAAAKHGRFTVALPAYGYPRLMADPAAVAPLIAAWTADRPENLESVIWFRLPVAGDTGTWHDATLDAVRAGRTPIADQELELLERDGVWTIILHNRGEASLPLPTLTLSDPLRFGDALGSYAWSPPDTFTPHADTPPLAPGDQLTVGWVRSPTLPEVSR